MAIDPDLDPILADIASKLAQLLEGQNTLAARVAVLEQAGPPAEEPEEPEEPGEDSPEGFTITAPGSVLTFKGQTYELVPTIAGNGIEVDGTLLPETNNVTTMFIFGGKLYQAAWGRFWERVGDGWGPELMEDPRTPVDPGVPAGEYPTLPAGMKKPGDYKASVNKWAAQWGVDELTFPSWFNGVMTHGDPALVNMRADGSAVLDAKYIGNEWHSGKLQMNKPTPSVGRWGVVASCEKPNAVCAFFLYGRDGAEMDFEYIKRGSVYGWSLAVHMPKIGGGMAHSIGPNFYFPMSQAEVKKVHLYEFDYSASKCDFYVDGALVATITPAQMDPGVNWKTDANFEAFCSVEKHGGWAGHEYPAGLEAQMIVWGIKVPD